MPLLLLSKVIFNAEVPPDSPDNLSVAKFDKHIEPHKSYCN